MNAVLHGHAPQAPLYVRTHGGTAVAHGAARCMGAVAALAAALPPARHAIQCCGDTLELAISTLAAWQAGQTVVMPSTRLASDVDQLRERYPDHHVLDTAVLRALLPATVPVDAGEDPVDVWLRITNAAWPPFTLADAFEAIILFTSGSTRAPQAQVKTWDALVRGAQTFERAFPRAARPPMLAGTVDCHHMFGLEANLMAGLRCGLPLCTSRPQFAADLTALLGVTAASDLGPLWLVTTPLQLENFHAALGAIARGPARVIVATMPLRPGLATAVERDWHTSVDEIFGNTELGVMATRRPSLAATYTPAPGMTFVHGDDDSVAVARAPDAPTLLDDRVQPVPGASDGAFQLLGRRSDMVKIAGKRTTLSALDDHARALPGVVDAAFAMGAHGRLGAAIVAPGMSRLALLRALASRVDPAFMPRPLAVLAALPRDANGKLPRAALLACIDGATDAAEAGTAPCAPGAPPSGGAMPARLVHEQVFAATHAVFPGHFPGDPLVPGALLLAEVEALLRAHGQVVTGCAHAKFLAPVRPDERCTVRVDCTRLPSAPFEITGDDGVRVRGMLLCAKPRA